MMKGRNQDWAAADNLQPSLVAQVKLNFSHSRESCLDSLTSKVNCSMEDDDAKCRTDPVEASEQIPNIAPLLSPLKLMKAPVYGWRSCFWSTASPEAFELACGACFKGRL